MKTINYNPDVLSCLANLSNDEVFTPPEVANQMLDMLPEELWSNPNATFLDPACKTGVFLREIAKRLLKGLEPVIPDLQERVDHIFQHQLYAIAITNLTGLLSRRSLYCSKRANGKYSITTFSDADGNIKFERTEHEWVKRRCKYCGASQSEYDRGDELETHAYQFIHTDNPKEIFNMKFDVIIGNPPYQLSDGGAQASAKPLYHIFIQKAKKLNPRYLCMIIPARWYAGGKGLNEFRNEMLNDNRITKIHDFINSKDCFSTLGDYAIKGGICYFLWERDRAKNEKNCQIVTYRNNNITSVMDRPLLEKGCDVFIRYNEAISILHKIQNIKEKTIEEILSPRKPFGFESNFEDFHQNRENNSIKIYAQKKKIGYIDRKKIRQHIDWVDKYKLLIPEAIGSGDSERDWVKPIIVGPGTCCTETYLVMGPFNTDEVAQNVYSYTQTKFFHFFLSLRKNTQHTTRLVYSFIPLQDFSEPWTDEKLYKKYDLTQEEINFIESMIRPME